MCVLSSAELVGLAGNSNSGRSVHSPGFALRALAILRTLTGITVTISIIVGLIFQDLISMQSAGETCLPTRKL
ncbi:hypothetical protein BDV27DRAFT_125188 [Aspergillus caelatus]|uniref:Uncharacterized protein n=1 Tax=Aspergillus caelatus TaxID=61420 RepID=A0A5N7ABF0_9EURO|nr:uncharacterized protein BDV27DRAFT_125188 [Aspergillus caelatus]KAE8366486.1 hypothetical protein BDV27DRAFT_125188 [Aspergillus caelatus]